MKYLKPLYRLVQAGKIHDSPLERYVRQMYHLMKERRVEKARGMRIQRELRRRALKRAEPFPWFANAPMVCLGHGPGIRMRDHL
jgi:hypothetical protein